MTTENTGSSGSVDTSTGSEGYEGSDNTSGEEGQGSVAPKAKVEPKAPKYRKVKIDGQDVDVDEDEVFKNYSKYTSADKEKQKVARERKEHEEAVKKFKADPKGFLSDKANGFDRLAIAQQIMREEIAASLEDPKDRALREREEELNKYKQRDEEEQTKTQQAQRQAVIQKRAAEMEVTLGKAMELTPFAKDPATQSAVLREMALYLRACKAAGESDVSPEDIVAHLSNRRTSEYKSVVSKHKGQELIDFLGEDVVKELRKADLANLRKGREAPETVSKEQWNGRGTEKRDDSRPMSTRDAIIRK